MDSPASFALGIFLITLALYAPGFLFFRALRFTRMHALIAAPLFSAALYAVLPILYYDRGILCTVPTTFVVALAVGAAAYAIARPWRRAGKPAFGLPAPSGLWRPASSPRETACDWALLALYLACGLAIGCIVFGGNLSTPDAAYIRYDNQTHLNVSKAFLDTGMWSSLHPNRYLDLPLDSRSLITQSSSFYPALLYALSALCAIMSSLKITAAFNATLFALTFIVFPLGIFGVMRTMFKDNRLLIVLGALASISFSGFPWGIWVRGLFPNAAAICLVAPALASSMMLLSHERLKAAIPRGVVLWAFALPAIGLAQPNAVYGAFVFLVAYAAHVAGDRAAARALPPAGAARGRHATGRALPPAIGRDRRRRWAAILVVAAAGLVIWVVATSLPPMQSVMHYFGNSIQHPWRVIRRLLTLRFDPFQGEWLLCFVVFFGVIACLRRKLLWVLVPAAWMGVSYALCRTGNTPIVHFLAGPFYCDHVRLGAFYCVFLMPIAAMGFLTIVNAVRGAASRIPPLSGTMPQAMLSAAAVLVCAAIIFWPAFTTPGGTFKQTGFGSVCDQVYKMFRIYDDHVYGSDEQAFVDKAREITGDDLVINYPADGSSFAYPVNDMEVYFRSIKMKHQTHDAKTIRQHLNEYAENPEVQQAIETTGAKWVMQLDYGVSYEDGTWFRQFRKPGGWSGIEHTDENTPGFTLVLEEGDMRLYRIDPL